jgi:uncharacterized protein (TIGR00369 family)
VVRIADLETGSYWRLVGMRTIADSEGKTQLIMDVHDNLKQYYGNVHGGVIAGLLDSSIAVAVNEVLSSDEGASTIEMKINYLRPVSKGTLRAEGRVIQKGRKIVVGHGEIKENEGNLVAVGTATFMISQLKP